MIKDEPLNNVRGLQGKKLLLLKILNKLPWLILFFTLSYILVMYFFSYMIDFKGSDLLGLGTWLEKVRPGYPLFWIYAFTEGSPTEHIQWTFIGVSLVLAAACFFVNRYFIKKISWGWLLLVLGLALMLGEDYYNIRHKTVDFIANYYNISPATMFSFLHLRTLVELVLYFLLGLLMVMALLLILKDREESGRGKKLLVTGYFFYALASISSATRGIGNWYARVGDFLLGDNKIRMASLVTESPYRGNLGFYFMDFVWEEPLELLGATFIVASLLVFLIYRTNKGQIHIDKR
ncbi:MAG: hypothetical protein D5R97_05595 [Candidatus Syntrophonatronum acetioxidans]|uniref:Uncharacterized protein n=1 Tax=Candidatus Syntrophonatronum acetioxidans TaxID=1795816 RepID=A0A424YDY3_9FIRM|nr:MAG: hypothetical protein D5R97_05595 [Candidatus Syntrophonatronum acetioxidans]